MILVGLGSSLPFCGAEPQEILRLAIGALRRAAPVGQASRLYRSPAWPDPSEPSFVNAVVILAAAPAPERLLSLLQGVEAAFGRQRGRKYAARTLDLDLLAYDDEVHWAEGLTLPHPALAERDFVLAPLCDIAPDWVSPKSGLTAREMLAALKSVAATPLAG